MPSQADKAEAHASHLLDAFLGLREKYALLAPMLFDAKVNELRGSHRQARGFKTLRMSLFLSCCQEIANLCSDASEKTPSISKLIAVLSDSDTRRIFEDKYAEWVVPLVEEEKDPLVLELLRKMEEQERLERRTQFHDYHARLESAWLELSSSSSLKGFSVIRDKVSAHRELRYVGDKYQVVDISLLGIKWVDLRLTIEKMQELVELLGLIIRNTGFAWDALDDQLAITAADFWSAPTR
ncbi:MAG: hypothetical protein V4650_08800 [Pseudomonadota bacterium]